MIYQKNLIRDSTRKIIKKINIIDRENASLQMTELALKLITNKFPAKIQNIACYWPMEHEINTIKLINNLLINNFSCFLPVINFNSQNLDFIKYTQTTTLIKNKFGILEPQFNANNQIDLNDLELIFMPLIAFDIFGHRIGSGSGLYDRTFTKQKFNHNCKLIGLAYSSQQVTPFIPDLWDINLDFVITEKEWLCFNNK